MKKDEEKICTGIKSCRKMKGTTDFLDEIITRRSLTKPDKLFYILNNHHPQIKLTIETNLDKNLEEQ